MHCRKGLEVVLVVFVEVQDCMTDLSDVDISIKRYFLPCIALRLGGNGR